MSGTTTRRTESDSLQQRAFLSLWRTYDRLRILEEELFDQFDLSAQQYNVLRLLQSEHPGDLATLELAGRLVSRAPDITRIVDKLERRGWVARIRPAHDRRSVRVAISASGLALLRKIKPMLRDCHRRQLGHMGNEELESLIALLRRARAPHEPAESLWKEPTPDDPNPGE